MAIDTAEKRKSISGVGLMIPGVTPNSSKDAEWRQQSGWSYSGIAAISIVVKTIAITVVLYARSLTASLHARSLIAALYSRAITLKTRTK